jgi:hypothetical protein
MAREVWRWWKETGVKCADAQTVNEEGKIENKLTVRTLKRKLYQQFLALQQQWLLPLELWIQCPPHRNLIVSMWSTTTRQCRLSLMELKCSHSCAWT